MERSQFNTNFIKICEKNFLVHKKYLIFYKFSKYSQRTSKFSIFNNLDNFNQGINSFPK